MADDLFPLQTAIVEVRLIGDQVTVIAVDHRDHFLQALDNFFVFPQPGLGPLVPGDVRLDPVPQNPSVRQTARRRGNPHPANFTIEPALAHFDVENAHIPGGNFFRGGERGTVLFRDPA